MTRSTQERPQTQNLHTSEMLQNVLQQRTGETIRLGELIQSLGSRAFGSTILICALPEALPLLIAGVSAIIDMPLVIFSAQLLLGFRTPWLPKWLADRRFKRRDFERIVRRILQYLHRFERVIRPRWKFATTPLVERLLGLLFLALAFVIVLPIPLGNMLPAIAIIVISLGLVEADGMLVVGGAIGANVILAIMTTAIMTFFSWAMSFLSQFISR
jgi:hypothetical protein